MQTQKQLFTEIMNHLYEHYYNGYGTYGLMYSSFYDRVFFAPDHEIDSMIEEYGQNSYRRIYYEINIFFVDRDDFLEFEPSVQNAVMLGTAYKLSHDIIVEARAIKRFMQRAVA